MAEQRTELNKTLNPANIWAVALGSIIGWGCFIQSPNWMVKAGGPLPLVVGFILGGLLMIVVGMSYAYMIAKFPVSGGEFAYAFVGFGPIASFVCGWMLLIGYVGIVVLNATAVPVLFSVVAPGLLQVGHLWTIAGWPVYLGEALVSIVIAWIFGIIAIRGAKSAGNTQLFMCILLCAAVVLILAGTVITGNFQMPNLQPASGQYNVSFVKGVILIIAMAPFLYVGFDCIPQAAEEFNFPANKTLLLIVSAIGVGAFIYASIAVVTAAVMPWMEMVDLKNAAGNPESWRTGAMIKQALGTGGTIFVVVAVLAGMFTGIGGFYMSSSRLMFGMARARMLPKMFAEIHPVYGTPTKGIIFVMIIATFVPFIGREVLNWFVDMAAVGTGVGYFFTCAGAYMVLTKGLAPKSSDDISPVVALAGAAISLGIIALMVVPGMPAFLSIYCWGALAAWVAMGVIFYFTSMGRFKATSAGMVNYLITGDKSKLTPAEMEAVEDCTPVTDCEVDLN
ncbi:MAG: APC family permease [Peptococcaceae bacterium]|nr:APC family permease [Peptococcaceae bacterium]